MPYYFNENELNNNKVHSIFGPYAESNFDPGDQPLIPLKSSHPCKFNLL